MKYLLTIFALCGLMTVAIAQPQYQSTDFAQPNDGFTVSSGDIVQNASLDFDTTGNNITWDFSTLVAITQKVDSFFDPTNTAHYSKFYNNCYLDCYDTCYIDTCTSGLIACLGICDNACNTYCNDEWNSLTNLAQPLGDTIDLGVVLVTDVYNFHHNHGTAVANTMMGYKFVEPITQLSATEILPFNNPDTLYQFPLQLGNMDQNFSSYDLIVDFDPFYSFPFAYYHRQTRSNEVEGWGTIVTPFGTFDSTLKVKTILYIQDTIELNDSIYTLQSLVGEQLAPDSIVEYKWFHHHYGVPLVEAKGFIINGETHLLGINFIDSLHCYDPTAFFGMLPPLTTFLDSTDTAQVSFYGLALNADSLHWDFGDPGSGAANNSGAQNPVHIYTQAGTYMVTQVACNTSPQCTTVKCDTITLPFIVVDSTQAVASFYTSPTFPCFGDTVFFINTSIKDTAWHWDFGDPATQADTANTADAYYVYSNAGEYNVTLIAQNGTSADTVVKKLLISGLVNTSFTYSDSITGVPIQFTNTTMGTDSNTTYLWSFNGGNPSLWLSFAENPVVTFNKAGSVTVCMTAWNSVGCSQTVCDTFNVVECMDVNYLNNSFNSTFCQDDTIRLSNTTTTGLADPISWNWKLNGDPFDTVFEPKLVIDSGGTYSIMLVGDNGRCMDSIAKNIQVRTYATLDVGPDIDFCTGDSVTLIANLDDGGQNLYGISWMPSMGLSATNQLVVKASPIIPTDYILNINFLAGTCDGFSVLRDTVRVSPGNNGPLPGFTFNAISDSTIQFTDASTAATSYLWRFGDGQTASSANPSHTYTATGSYTVTQIVSNSCGMDSVQMMVNITCTTPNVFMKVDQDTICLDEMVPLTNFTTGASTYDWDFGNGDTSDQFLPVYSYNNIGQFEIFLMAAGTFGCSSGTRDTVDVIEYPQAGFLFHLEDSTVQLTSNAPNATTWWYDFGDGAVDSVADPLHMYADTGLFTITQIVTNGFCSDTTSLTLYVGCPFSPPASFTMSLDSACVTQPILFTNTSPMNGIASVIWDFGDGTQANIDSNITRAYNNGGEYTVSLTVLDSLGCTGEAFDTLYVSPYPVADFNWQYQGNGLVDLTDNSQAAQSWSWDFGDGNMSSMTSPSHTYTATGTYTVMLIISNICFNDTMTQMVTVDCSIPPSANFAVDTNLACFTHPITTTNNSNNATSWMWDYGDGSTSSSENPVPYQYTSGGQYNIALLVSDDIGCVDSAKQAVTLHGFADSSFSYNSFTGCELQFQSNGTDIMEWHWDFGDNGTDTAASPLHQFPGSGSYDVTLTVTNACGSTQHTETVELASCTDGLDPNPSVIRNLNIFPNPYLGTTTIQFSAPKISADQVQIGIYSLLGQEVFTPTLAANWGNPNGQIQFQFSAQALGYPAGVYLLKVQVEEQVVVHRLVELR